MSGFKVPSNLKKIGFFLDFLNIKSSKGTFFRNLCGNRYHPQPIVTTLFSIIQAQVTLLLLMVFSSKSSGRNGQLFNKAQKSSVPVAGLALGVVASKAS